MTSTKLIANAFQDTLAVTRESNNRAAAPSSLGRGHLVELVADLPGRGLSRRDREVDVSLGADRGTRRPQIDFRDRPVAGLADARARLAILETDVVVPGGRAESRQLGLQALSRLQLPQIHEVLPPEFGSPVERAGRRDLERN